MKYEFTSTSLTILLVLFVILMGVLSVLAATDYFMSDIPVCRYETNTVDIIYDNVNETPVYLKVIT